MKSKTQHVDGGVATRILKHFVYEDQRKMRFAKHRSFNKDTQIQIYKPKSMETPMKSKPRHGDGGGRKSQFEAFRI